MRDHLVADEALVHRLPLPLAQLYRRAHNAKSALERHNTAFYLWEAALKLLASVAVVEYAERPTHDPQLTERLKNLARPALGHWWEIVRKLVPIVAEQHDAGFAGVRDCVLGKSRDDLPRAAGLDAALREALEGKKQARATVNLTELFDRLVQYRNKEIGHGASGRRAGEHYRTLGMALLVAAGEVLGRVDCLAGRRLLGIAEVRRQASGAWLVERCELVGEAGRRIESLEVPEGELSRLPKPERAYAEWQGKLRSLHPLIVLAGEQDEVLILNGRRGNKGAEYLNYTTGLALHRPDLGNEQRALLGRILDMEVSEDQAAAWAARSEAEEPSETTGPASRQLGEFELLSELGRGGMGVVYRARQPSLGRQVALKKLQKSGDLRAEARFAREIHALGRVEHPHLVKIFTSGSEGDQWFYAMELIEGAPLSEVCSTLQSKTANVGDLDLDTWQEAVSSTCEEARRTEKPLNAAREPPPSAAGADEGSPGLVKGLPGLPPSAPATRGEQGLRVGHTYVAHIVGLIAQAAGAAHALHEAGILHRDIKPGNLMVTADGSQAVLMDLGLAKLADDVEGRLTRTRQFVGTLRYASPEQLAGARLDRRADVYSLGATLWELLALKPLFGITDNTPTPNAILKVQQAEPERLRKLYPGLSRDLEAIVHKCLEKEPNRRYPTAHELALDLEQFLASKPVVARAVSGWERAWKWIKRHPAPAAVYGLIAVVTVLGLVGGGMAWLWLEATAARDSAETARNQTAEEWKRAENEKVLANNARADAVSQKHLADDARRQTDQALRRSESLFYCLQIQQADRCLPDFDLVGCQNALDDCLPELRGPEYDLVSDCKRRMAGALRGHSDVVSCLALSSDGKRLFSGSHDGTIKVWDLDAGKVTRSFSGHSGGISNLVLSADGKHLFSGSYDKTIKVWDLELGKDTLTLSGHSDGITSIALSADGKHLYSGSHDTTIKFWDLMAGKSTKTLAAPGGASSLAVSADGKRLFWGSYNGTIAAWDLEAGKEGVILQGPSTGVRSLAVSSDGKRLFSGSEDASIKAWDLESGKSTATLRGHFDFVTTLVLSSDGKRLYSGSLDKTIKVWDLKAGKDTLTLRGGSGAVHGLALRADGRRLFSGNGDSTITVWDLEATHETLSLRGDFDGVSSLALSADSKRLFSGSFDASIRVWDIAAAKETATLRGHADGVSGLILLPDGKRLFSAGLDGMIIGWDLETRLPKERFRGHGGGVTCLALSQDGKRLFSGSYDETVRVWDVAKAKELATFRGHKKGVSSLALSSDGKWLFSGSFDNTIKAWDLGTGKDTLTLRGHASGVGSLVLSPDGTQLYSGSFDTTIKVWDLVAAKETLTLRGHASGVSSLILLPASRRLISGSYDGTIKFWNLDVGKEALTLRRHASGVSSLVLSPDSKRLYSGGFDATLKLWELDAGPSAVQAPH
jgi:WD40 repeat protein/serine/threonine protein kinase